MVVIINFSCVVKIESTPISSADKLITIRSAKHMSNKSDVLEMSSINTTTSASITPDGSPELPINKKHVKIAPSGKSTKKISKT